MSSTRASSGARSATTCSSSRLPIPQRMRQRCSSARVAGSASSPTSASAASKCATAWAICRLPRRLRPARLWSSARSAAGWGAASAASNPRAASLHEPTASASSAAARTRASASASVIAAAAHEVVGDGARRAGRLLALLQHGGRARVQRAHGRRWFELVRGVLVDRMREHDGVAAVAQHARGDGLAHRVVDLVGLEPGQRAEERPFAFGGEHRGGDHDGAGRGAQPGQRRRDGRGHRVTGGSPRRTRGRRAVAPAGERVEQERVAAAGDREVARPVHRGARVELARQLDRLELGQHVQLHHRGARFAAQSGHTFGRTRRGIGAGRRQHQQRHLHVVEAEEEVAQQVDGGGVGPVDVVDEHHARCRLRVLEHQLGEREQLAGAVAFALVRSRRRSRRRRGGWRATPRHRRDPAGATGPSGHVTVERGEQRVAEGEVREVEVVVAATPQHRGVTAAGVVERRVGEARLPDPRFALDEHQVREAAEREVDARAQPAQLDPSPDQRARRRRRPLEGRARHRASVGGSANRWARSTLRSHAGPEHDAVTSP